MGALTSLIQHLGCDVRQAPADAGDATPTFLHVWVAETRGGGGGGGGGAM